MNGKRSHNFRVFTNFLAFAALVAIAVLSIVAVIVPKTTNLSAVLLEIARYLAYFLVAMSSLWYVLSKRGYVVKVIWLVCAVGIIVLMFV